MRLEDKVKASMELSRVANERFGYLLALETLVDRVMGIEGAARDALLSCAKRRDMDGFNAILDIHLD